MEKQAERKRLLIGSMSILSAAALVSVVFGPSIFLNDPEMDEVKVVGLRDLWDIIVPDDFGSIREAVKSAVSGDRIVLCSRSLYQDPGRVIVRDGIADADCVRACTLQDVDSRPCVWHRHVIGVRADIVPRYQIAGQVWVLSVQPNFYPVNIMLLAVL